MQALARLLFSGLALCGLLAAEAPIEEMHRGIRDYLLKLPVKGGRLGYHPLLLETDRCEAAMPREVVVLLSYRNLDCSKYPGVLVIAPRLIHPDQRERVRRMGYPFGMAPLGFELAYWTEARRTYRRVIRTEPAMDQIYGPVENPRMQENAFGMSIRPHDESVVERSTRDVSKIEKYLLELIPEAETRRMHLLRLQGAEHVAARWHSEVVGELPRYKGDLAARVQPLEERAEWKATSVTIDALPGVIAQGVLLEPKTMRPGQRLPLIVVQHGLMASPQSLYGQPEDSKDFKTYRNFAERLVAEGFIVFCPQNFYAGDFRGLQLLANPRGLSLFAFAEAQYGRLVDYLVTLPQVDTERIGYYGLSYGGATAVRVPVFDPRFKAVVCGGNFNEWIRKLVSPELRYSYVHTKEYEIYEWNQANIASHAELAAMGTLLRARATPFLVERGHQDSVGEDRWVEYEFERLKQYVRPARLRQLAYFDGEHRTDGAASIPFLKSALK